MRRITFTYLIVVVAICSPENSAIAQEIDFGSYGQSVYQVQATSLSNLDFGILFTSETTNTVTLQDGAVVEIAGIEYLDVFVSVTPDNNYLLNDDLGCSPFSNCIIPLDLNAAFINRGEANGSNTSLAVIMTESGGIPSAFFALKYRGNAPPGPPPTPIHAGFDPNNAAYQDKAYIYIYGSLSSINNAVAGSYSANITVSVSYD